MKFTPGFSKFHMSKMKNLALLLVFFCGASAFAGEGIEDKLKLILEKNPNFSMLAVVFNSSTHTPDQIPNSVKGVTIAKVPLASLRDVATTLNKGLLANYDVQGIYLMDDKKKLVTNSRTVKYIVKLGLKKGFMTFSDAEDLDVKVTGRIAMKDGKLGIELADDQ
ncbi:hypothetical protein SCOR_17960 [Sulfidibacter corallicola]|uniref:TolB amino-terminal domain-containing protein n=1 Tax=Sulfidibacter corallicola TaxID=2818388 RepID=A0A8A4TWT7_SULCO|nr:hypothetical protein [Sulfidibacter corallicola]QTD53661.1 hypothetical protein J3U87_14500 [Sulfidibacter corallicola]